MKVGTKRCQSFHEREVSEKQRHMRETSAHVYFVGASCTPGDPKSGRLSTQLTKFVVLSWDTRVPTKVRPSVVMMHTFSTASGW